GSSHSQRNWRWPWRENNVQTDSKAMVRGIGARYRRICCNVGRDSSSGSGNGTVDWVEREQCVLECSQFTAVTAMRPGKQQVQPKFTFMTRFSPSFGFVWYYRFTPVAAADSLERG